MRFARALERSATTRVNTNTALDVRRRRSNAPRASIARTAEDVGKQNASVDLLLDALGANERATCSTNADGVRGLFAKRPLARGEPVLEVPLGEFALMDDPGSQTTWSRQLARKVVELRRRALERDEATTIMRHYAMSLPKFGAPAIGLANDPSRVRALAVEWDCKEAVADMTTFAKQVDDSYARELELDQTLREDEWRWAVSLVHSRTFRIEDERGKRPTRRALIAAADLLNHSSVKEEVNCDWSANDEYFVVSTTREVREGEELLISYGEQCDRHFALFYGFVPRRNPYNRVKLFFNGREALDWYQALCGAPPDAPGWHNEKERVVKLVCDKYGTYKLDKATGLRRRVIQDLYLGEGGKVNESMLLLFNEMCGDEDMAIAAVRERAKELREKMIEATARIDASLDGLDDYSRALVRDYRQRKIDILSHII